MRASVSLSLWHSLRLVPFVCVTLVHACAHDADRPQRVAVFPVDTVGAPPTDAKNLRRALVSEVENSDTMTATSVDKIDDVLISECDYTTDFRLTAGMCAERVGPELEATHVLLSAVGGLGSTYVLQLKLFSVESKAIMHSSENTIFGERSSREAAVQEMTRRLLGIEKTEWYEHWWLWATVAVVTATAITLPFVLSDGDDYSNVRLP